MKINKYLIATLLSIGFIGIIVIVSFGRLGNINRTGKLLSAAAVSADLSTATDFSVLAALSMAANGTGTTISGNLGLSPGLAVSRTGTWSVGGTEYFGIGAESESAQADALMAFNDLASQTPDGLWASASPVPGVYNIAADTTFAGPTLTLNGGYDDVWVFQIGNDMTFTGNVVMEGNAQPCNVFWQIGRDATITSGSDFVGTLIASRDVTVASGATVDGRIISLNSSLVFESGNTVSEPTCEVAPPPAPSSGTLHIIKTVVNDNGGTAIASDFTIDVAGTNVSSSSFAGSEVGVDVTLDAGSYAVTETSLSGYLQSGSGDCSGTILADETKTCTITNDDIAPTLVVSKVIINDNSGTKLLPSDFSLKIDGVGVTHGVINTTTIGLHTVSETVDSSYTTVVGGHCSTDGTITLALGDIKTCTVTNDDIAPSGGGGSHRSAVPPLIDLMKVPSPLSLPSGAGPVTYTYTLRNIGTVPVTDITMVGDTCSPIGLVSGDINKDVKLDVDEIWTYNCFTTLSKTHTNIVTATGEANGITATDIASATVVVGLPVIPPLIHVTKVPNPLALFAGGGMVTYTNKVTNPGTVALSNVQLIDDKCGSVKYISGDINNDSKLDIAETWTYTCQANLLKTTTNTITAQGDANGLTAKDFAIATVVVSVVPGLPKTGFPPKEE